MQRAGMFSGMVSYLRIALAQATLGSAGAAFEFAFQDTSFFLCYRAERIVIAQSYSTISSVMLTRRLTSASQGRTIQHRIDNAFLLTGKAMHPYAHSLHTILKEDRSIQVVHSDPNTLHTCLNS